MRTRVKRIAVGFGATFLVAGAAFAFYAAVLSGGSGSITDQTGTNNAQSVAFQIVADTQGMAANNPVQMTPGQGCQVGANQTLNTLPGSDGTTPCNVLPMIAHNTSNDAGHVTSVTLTGIDAPAGCDTSAFEIIWPDGTVSGSQRPANDPGQGPENQMSYQFGQGGAPLPDVTANSDTPLFTTADAPGSWPQAGDTQPPYPVVFFNDNGTDQSACAGGNITFHFTAATAA